MLKGTIVDQKLNKVKRLAVYPKELYAKYIQNRGSLLINVVHKNGEIIVTKNHRYLTVFITNTFYSISLNLFVIIYLLIGKLAKDIITMYYNYTI